MNNEPVSASRWGLLFDTPTRGRRACSAEAGPPPPKGYGVASPPGFGYGVPSSAGAYAVTGASE